MTITQTVDIPADRRLTIDVPHEIPVGRVILSFTPATNVPKAETGKKIRLTKSLINEILQDETVRFLSGIVRTDMSLEEIREERLAKHLK